MTIWKNCLRLLQDELPPQQFNTWIRPLHAEESENDIRLLAPNRFVMDWVSKQYLNQITQLAQTFNEQPVQVQVQIGSSGVVSEPADASNVTQESQPSTSNLNSAFTFENHVEGKSNQLARAASIQVGENPGEAYNPLFLYGGVGLGKTHLMQAAGNLIISRSAKAKVMYVHAERFVSDMVRSLQHNTMNDFKRRYRSLDALLIDDIQFFSGKNQSQEEFFHTFNNLIEGSRQVVITSDRLHKEISGVQERLISRFGSGLVVPIDPPELETRVAILNKKARRNGVKLPEDVAFFVANQIRSNVRELEGALHRIAASARFTNRAITIDLVRDVLRDILVFQEKQVTVNNIQRSVAEYFNIRVADLNSRRRNRQIARPRQVAMALAKELTQSSLPEIGEAFGGRDHTTVLHACRKINELRQQNEQVREDYHNLHQLLVG